MGDLINDRISERILECGTERRAYELWLGCLTPANFALAGVGGVLSLVSGLSIVAHVDALHNLAGWGAITGAILTGFHSRLRCDAHQTECRKLMGQFAELQTEYQRLQLHEEPKEKQKDLLQLEHKLAAIRAGQTVIPGKICAWRIARKTRG